MEKVNATGVVFKRAGKIYDFLTNGVQLKRGDFAIIETEKGEDLATVVFPDREITPAEGQEFKKIIRKATEQDIENLKKNREEEPKALEECKKLVEQHGLEMKLLKAEYTLDRTRVTFYFTADGRVDFRQLVRDLARIFKTRIEMRQVGVRDATKILGGFGICGREFCCSTFLRNFDNISIKMAKDQNLLLNPGKISGVCGRLMCCLMYEKDGYDVVEEGVEYVELKDFIDENTGGKDMNKPTFYVTTPIYYVNDVPHIGHAYTTVACDIISRYKRLSGYDVFFLTGTDEHGQKIEQAAQQKGMTPKELADSVVQRYKNLWEKLNISNNHFIRTTDESHKKTVQEVFKRMQENGDIYLDEYEGWYCTPCETYWTETQLLDGNCCPSCRRETTKLKEPSYFFNMSKYQEKLLKHIEENPDFIKPASRRNEIIAFIKEGLRNLSVSRVSFKWGIPVPGDEKHVIYVWIDALTNYISALNYFEANSELKKYWPADFHVVGKDILRFHTVYWPTMLMSLGIDLPKSIFAHGWWTVEGQKMSKSLGNAIDPNWLIEKFGVDPIRYFLMREVPFGLDGDFSFKALIHRINSDLANDFGNLLNRTLGMVKRYFNGDIPAYKVEDTVDVELFKKIEDTFDNVELHLKDLAFNKALIAIWELVSALNKYIDTTAPWALAKDKENRDRLETVLYTSMDGIRALSLLIYPFMPDTAIKIREQLNITEPVEKNSFEELKRVKQLKAGGKIGEVTPIFPRLDENEIIDNIKSENKKDEDKKNNDKTVELIDFAHFMTVQIKAGKIIEAEKVEKSEKLLKLKVDLGQETRQIIAGIAKSYLPGDLVGKTVAVVANLKPAKLMGLMSEGMVLAAAIGDKHRVLELPDEVAPGTIIK